MYCPFGASKPKAKPNEKEPENPSWSLQMSFGDDQDCQQFQQRALEFDQFMINEACKPDNSAGWLGSSKNKPYSKEVVESKYSPMIKYAKKDGEVRHEYPPFIRVQFPTTYKTPIEFTCEIYGANNQSITVSPNPVVDNSISKMIPPGVWCSALLSGSIWCTTGGFGVSWRIAQLKVYPPKGLPKGRCLVSDPEESEIESEKEDEKTTTPDSDVGEIVEEIEIIEEDASSSPNPNTSPSKNI